MKLYRNIMEDLAEDTLDSMVGQMDFCNCSQCRADIIALALNHLPPQYAVTSPGASISKLINLQAQHQADIQKELLKAILIVSKHPRHEEKQEDSQE